MTPEEIKAEKKAKKKEDEETQAVGEAALAKKEAADKEKKDEEKKQKEKGKYEPGFGVETTTMAGGISSKTLNKPHGPIPTNE